MAKVLPLTPDNSGEWEPSILNSAKSRADADVGPISVGLELCRARQRSGKTLADVSNETKIPLHHLMAMERNRFDALPGRVYAVGFVRNYAACVGLDAEPLILRLKAQIHGSEPALPVISIPARKREDPDAEVAETSGSDERAAALLSPRERKWPQAATAAVLVVAAAVYCVSFFLFYSEQMAQPGVRSVPPHLVAEAGLVQEQADAQPSAPVGELAPVAAEQGTSPPPVAQTPAVSSAAEPAPPTHLAKVEVSVLPPLALVEPQPVPIPWPAPAAEAASEPGPGATPFPPVVVRPKPALPNAVASKPSLASLNEPAPTIEAALDVTPAVAPLPRVVVRAKPASSAAVASKAVARVHGPLPLGRNYGSLNRDARIILRAHRPIRVAVLGPGSRIFLDQVLDAGDTYRVPNMNGLKLSASDAGAIEIILDDTTVGFASKDGAVARGLSLDPQSIVDRQSRE
jgi:cytoskeletal protein RodZ